MHADAARSALRRTGVGRRRVCGVRGVRADRGAERRTDRARRAADCRAADDRDRRAWATTCRTPIRVTTRRRTSRSASCRRSTRRHGSDTSGSWRRSQRALEDLAEWLDGVPDGGARARMLKTHVAPVPRVSSLQPQCVAAHAARVRYGRHAVRQRGRGRGRRRRRHRCRFSAFTTEAVRDFLGTLHDRGISRASSARRLAALRTFARYLVREEVLARGSDGARRHSAKGAAPACAPAG